MEKSDMIRMVISITDLNLGSFLSRYLEYLERPVLNLRNPSFSSFFSLSSSFSSFSRKFPLLSPYTDTGTMFFMKKWISESISICSGSILTSFISCLYSSSISCILIFCDFKCFSMEL